MNMRRRFSHLVLSCLMFVCSGVVLLMALRFVSLDGLDRALSSFYRDYRAILVGLLLLLILSGLIRLLFFGTGKTMASVRDTSLGKIRISLHALDSYVRSSACDIEGINEIKSIELESVGEGIGIRLTITGEYGVRILELAEELQHRIRNDMRKKFGLTLEKIDIILLDLQEHDRTQGENGEQETTRGEGEGEENDDQGYHGRPQ